MKNRNVCFAAAFAAGLVLLPSASFAGDNGCTMVKIVSLGIAKCAHFGAAPQPPAPGGSRDAPGTYIGTTTAGPLKVAPVGPSVWTRPLEDGMIKINGKTVKYTPPSRELPIKQTGGSAPHPDHPDWPVRHSGVAAPHVDHPDWPVRHTGAPK